MGIKTNINRCKCCGICIHFRPKKILTLNDLDKIAVIDKKKCIKCKQCELRCPNYAIFITEKEDKQWERSF